MKFGSVLNNFLVHNLVKQNINTRLIMVMESKYIKKIPTKSIIRPTYLIFLTV